MHTITVLVTGIGSCGPAEGVVKSLKMVPGKYRVVGTDIKALSAMLFRVDAAYQVPPCAAHNYFDALRRICQVEAVDVLIPGTDAEMDVITNNAKHVPSNVFLLAHPRETVNICRDAWMTYLFLTHHGFSCPESYLPDDRKDLEFPLVVKDRFGGGSRNNIRVENEQELSYAVRVMTQKGIKPIVQEYVGSMEEEYTTGIVFSKHKELLSAITFQRDLIAGASGNMVCREFRQINEGCAEVVSKLATRGSINVQSRLLYGRPCIFEMNARFSGSCSARAGLGVNEVDISIDTFFLGVSAKPRVPQTSRVVMRCFQEVYGDLADVRQLERGECLSHAGEVFDYV